MKCHKCESEPHHNCEDCRYLEKEASDFEKINDLVCASDSDASSRIFSPDVGTRQICFLSDADGNSVLIVDEDGVEYKGERLNDVGKVYNALVEYLNL